LKTLLLVDDDADVRAALLDLVAFLLERDIAAGAIKVVAAASGEDAVAAAAMEPPDVILMDVHLPGIDGVEAYMRIAAARGGRAPRTLFLTGYAGSGPLQHRLAAAAGAGQAIVLSKPVAAAVLAEHLANALADAGETGRG
jgi:CheY-like chemotaxis protein